MPSPSNLPQLRQLLSDAHSSQSPLRISGAGTWLHAGRPVTSDNILDIRNLNGIVEYVPGDLVITVGAGTTLGDIARVTAEHDQWLALDPFVTRDALDVATIGATVATASHGPLAHSYGKVRDLVLGLTFVSGDGTAVRAGGRVVKNVAGFDLVRLATGSWGTLGVISEVSLRLHARPAIDESFAVAIDLPSDATARDAQLTKLVARLNAAPLLNTMSALASFVMLSHEAARDIAHAHSLPATSVLLLARAMGNPTRVAAQRTVLAQLGDVVAIDREVWNNVRTLPEGTAAFRVSDAALRTASTWHRVDAWLTSHRATARVITEPLRGTVRVMADFDATHSQVFELPARSIAEHLPVGAWESQRTGVDDEISQQLQRVFDPANILNRGLLASRKTGDWRLETGD